MTTILIQGDIEKILMEKTTFTLWKSLETLYAIKFLAHRLVLK
ncbi:hypothetical protein Gotur_024953, partial [Gossypium turneri]